MLLRKLFIAAVVLLSAVTAKSQQMPPIPVDPDVRIGHLDNGLTYYIRHNAFPGGVASYYIAQKVGSLQEEDSERGLAHLLEHLAFNGTDHFKDNDLQEYLQSIGVEYGRNLNATTSIDRTCYYITDVPTIRESIVDSCMLILRDWSNGITLTDKAIEDERDVVHNEYRVRMAGNERMMERSLPLLYPGCKYGERMTIGLMSVVDQCTSEQLRGYYEKWYHPDNQAIIIVGDIDVDKIEGKVKALFSDITASERAAKVVPVPVPDNKDAIYVVDKDKEALADAIIVSMKHDATPKEKKNDMTYLVQKYINDVIAQMLNQRYEEKSKEPDCPYLSVEASEDKYLISATKNAFCLNCYAKTGKDIEAYEAILAEAKRAAEYGFTMTEYVRAREDFLSQKDKAYSNRDKMTNDQFMGMYVDNFTDNEPIPSAQQEYKTYRMFVSNLPLEMINATLKKYVSLNDSNFVVFLMLQEDEGRTYPTPAELAAATARVRAEKLDAYVDDVRQEPLVATIPKAGTIKKTSENKVLGITELTLSNGARVVLKKTDFKDDEVLFYAYANGGSSSYPQSKATSIVMLDEVAKVCGLGNFSNTELQKALAGKQVECSLSATDYERLMSGSSTPRDIETLFQLIYLNMTNLSKDSKSVENMRTTYSTLLANQSSSPDVVYADSLASAMYNNNKLYRVPKSDELVLCDLNYSFDVLKQLFSSARDFTFLFVGNFDERTIMPLIQTYLASIPNSGKKTVTNTQLSGFKGEVSKSFTMRMQNPYDKVTEYWHSAPMENSLRNRVTADIAGRVLSMYYNRTIREKLSAAYNASADGTVFLNADGTLCYDITAEAQLNPAKTDEAISYFFSGMKETVANPTAEAGRKVKEILLKQADVNATMNNYWLSVIARYLKYGIDVHTDYKATVSSVDGKTVSDFLQTVLSSGNHLEVLMRAEK